MLKPIFATTLFVLNLNAAAWAETAPRAPLNEAQQKALAARSCDLPKIADTVPLNRIPGTDLMTAPVQINGKTEPFLLDIGTRASSVSQAATTGLGLTEDFRIGQDINSGAGILYGTLFNIPVYDTKSGVGKEELQTNVRAGSLTIGNATARHMVIAVSRDKDMGISEPYDGLLTGDFFRQYDVELDFPGGRMTYLTPTNCTDPNQVVFWAHSDVGIIPITLAPDGRLQAQVLIKGRIFNAEFDTSSARSVMRRDVAEHGAGLTDADMAPVDGLKDNTGMQVHVHKFPEIIIGGGITALNIPVLIQDYSTTRTERKPVLGSRAQFDDAKIADLTIGMDILHRLHMFAVLGQGRIYVTQGDAVTTASATAARN